MHHEKDHHILYPLQHDFRDKRSSETRLLGFIKGPVNKCYMHDGFQTDISVMDFGKAFDTDHSVCHRLPIRKLMRCGIYMERTSYFCKSNCKIFQVVSND